MKRDRDKTKEQLINELAGLRQRVAKLETLERKYKWLEEALRESKEKYKALIDVICKDITELKQAEEDLERIFDLSIDMLCVAGLDGYFKRLNPAFQKTLGYTNKALLSKPFLEFIHPEDRDASAAEIKKLANGKTTVSFENRYRCKDGSYKSFIWDIVPLAEDGLVYAVAHDITERKWAEEALRKSEEFKSSLLEDSPIPIMVVNPDTSIGYVNPVVEEITGFTSAEIVGVKAPYPWWIEDERSGNTSELIRNMPEEIRGLEKLLQKKSGETFWIEVTSVPVMRDGELQYKISSWVDITERKRAEEREREVETFSSHTIH